MNGALHGERSPCDTTVYKHSLLLTVALSFQQFFLTADYDIEYPGIY